MFLIKELCPELEYSVKFMEMTKKQQVGYASVPECFQFV